MRKESLDYLVCPACKGNLTLKKEACSELEKWSLFCVLCNRLFKIVSGIPDLTFPDKLLEQDLKNMKSYDENAEYYDDRQREGTRLLFGLDYDIFWKNYIRIIGLQLENRMLDISTGTAENLLFAAEHIGKSGLLVGIDLSQAMLLIAKRKARKQGTLIYLQKGNAAYLPYKDDYFDIVLNVGGIDIIADKKRAIHEMNRVVKPKGKVAMCDKGLNPIIEKTNFGRNLVKGDSLYAEKPPLDLLPKNIEGLKVEWMAKGALFHVEFRKR